MFVKLPKGITLRTDRIEAIFQDSAESREPIFEVFLFSKEGFRWEGQNAVLAAQILLPLLGPPVPAEARGHIFWANEDEAPDVMPPETWGASKFVDCCRMFPYVLLNGERHYLVRLEG